MRIVCHELESWYFGDLAAVSRAYGKDLTKYARKRQYRSPDEMPNAREQFRALLPSHQQISGTKKIAPYMYLSLNTSPSSRCFVNGVRRIAGIDTN